VYEEAKETDDGAAPPQKLPSLTIGEALSLLNIIPKQHFTQPPPRFNEATLVKTLEEQGIGRPSTYAPTIATIVDREYVRKEGRQLIPTQLGMVVNDQLVAHFPDIVDVGFTAEMEDHLDKVETGDLEWHGILADFYTPFEAMLKKATTEMKKVQILSDEICEQCGKPFAVRSSRYGSFLGCTGYPECKNIRRMGKNNQPPPEDRPSEEPCEACGQPMVIRAGRYGDYLACTACKANRPLLKKTGVACPLCGTEIVEKRGRKAGKVFYGCSAYPKCDFVLWDKPNGEMCQTCKSLMVIKTLKKGTYTRCSNKTCAGEHAPKTAKSAELTA
jgi:DNA topoisomerase-1